MADKLPANRELQLAIAMASLGFELLIPTTLGWLVDSRFGIAPWGILLGAALGMTLVLVHALRLGKLDQKPGERNP